MPVKDPAFLRHIRVRCHLAVYLFISGYGSRCLYIAFQLLYEHLAPRLQCEIISLHIALIQNIHIVSDVVDGRDQCGKLRNTLCRLLRSHFLIHKIDRRQVCFPGDPVSSYDLRSKCSITRQSVKCAYIQDSHRHDRRMCDLPRRWCHLHLYGIGTSWIPLWVISIVLYKG